MDANGLKKLDLSMIRETRSETNEVPSLRKRLIESTQRFIPFNPYDEDGYNKQLDLVAGYDLIELEPDDIVEEEEMADSEQIGSTNRDHKSLALSSDADNKDGGEMSAQSMTKLEMEFRLKNDVIKMLSLNKFEHSIIKMQRIFRQRKEAKLKQVEENFSKSIKGRKKEKTLAERLFYGRKLSMIVPGQQENIMAKIASLRRSVSLMNTNLIDIKRHRRPIITIEKDVDIKKLKNNVNEGPNITRVDPSFTDFNAYTSVEKSQASLRQINAISFGGGIPELDPGTPKSFTGMENLEGQILNT